MDTTPATADSAHALRPETEAERQDRFAWEAEGIAEARAELDAGRYVDIADVRAWIDSLGTDRPLPVPNPRHSRPLDQRHEVLTRAVKT